MNIFLIFIYLYICVWATFGYYSLIYLGGINSKKQFARHLLYSPLLFWISPFYLLGIGIAWVVYTAFGKDEE